MSRERAREPGWAAGAKRTRCRGAEAGATALPGRCWPVPPSWQRSSPAPSVTPAQCHRCRAGSRHLEAQALWVEPTASRRHTQVLLHGPFPALPRELLCRQRCKRRADPTGTGSDCSACPGPEIGGFTGFSAGPILPQPLASVLPASPWRYTTTCRRLLQVPPCSLPLPNAPTR